QRRHQKVIEESPSPVVGAELRERMGAVAVRAAQAAGYTNAGTVEFLLAPDGEFYFLEVNARLQVEHPVTELVTGLDLVHEQIRIAAGEPLGYDQSSIQPRGYAIECRINAEDPFKGYLPSTGTIVDYRAPDGPGVRVDGMLEAGASVGVHYDSLLAKLIVCAPDRARGLRRMRRALAEFLVLGVRTSIPLHQWLLEQPDVVQGAVDTGWLEREWHGQAQPDAATVEAAALSGALLADAGSAPTAPIDRSSAVDGWRLVTRRMALR
ncbi:MAG: acetyl-CoA carboxylase biotin carboxylase subunit, partial [Chloroflexi bacterium]|nr:acetyl-CoA carboxylase biotin carboxylase subunit [Chloroflexota bacterium]